MSERQQAIDYLLGPWHNGPLWTWSEGGRVIAWTDGPTIAFREELTFVLDRFAEDGLPPLFPVLLLLSATRGNWPEHFETIRDRLGPAVDSGLCLAALDGLSHLHALLPGLRGSLAGKSQLVVVVCENRRERTSPHLASAVLRILREGDAGSFQLDTTASDPLPRLDAERDFRILIEGIDRVDPERLALRVQTGLDELPEPAEEELPPGEAVRALLKQLEDDDEFGGLARLARDLMAAVTLPRAVSEPDELPQGGVSDLTNRGPLDRLLLSELAHDDLTLAIRIATGAALYRRRERPPNPRPRQRAVLLDAGLRSWGVPRIFTTAVALALTATADRHTTVLCHRARGSEVVPVDLTTRAGLIAHLSALEPEVHPGDALPAFVELLTSSEIDSDAVLLAGEDVHADANFQRMLSASGIGSLIVGSVNRDGRLTLLARGERGTRLLREARLDINSLYRSPRKAPAPLIDPSKKHDRPAILSLRPFPLRLAHPRDPNRLAFVEGVGVFGFPRDRRLLLWDTLGLAARQLADDLPRGRPVWHYPYLIEGKAYAILAHAHDPSFTLLAIDPKHGEVARMPLKLTASEGRGFCYHGALFAVGYRVVPVFDLATGERRQNCTMDGSGWLRDRFYMRYGTNAHRYFALSYDGRAVRCVEIQPIDYPLSPDFRTLFERRGVDGPIALTSTDELLHTATGQRIPVRHNLTGINRVEVSATGNRLLLSGYHLTAKAPRTILVDTETGNSHFAGFEAKGEREGFGSFVYYQTPRVRFRGIRADHASNRLVLLTRKQRGLAVTYEEVTKSLQLRDFKDTAVNVQNFSPAPTPEGVGYRLSVATWPDGSRAFLDCRGLLHLMSADPSIPEMTLVLRDGPLAVWCSDAGVFGPSYFTGASHRDVTIPPGVRVNLDRFVRALP